MPFGLTSGAVGAVKGGAGLAGLGPLAIPLLLSFAPALFSKLFGGDPNEELRRQIAQLLSPGSQGALTQQFFQQALGSPAFSQAQGSIATGANATAAQLAQSLGARGIGTTGTGAVLSSLLPSVVGGQQAQLRTTAFQGAQSQAQQSIEQQIRALLGTQGPSPTQQFTGVGLQAFSPFLLSFLTAKYPGLFGPTMKAA